jgi:eukaryotic-like serine/threonine-protein kinase
MPLSAGEKLGPYEILTPIGTGGMGEVYKARDVRLDRTVAVKISKEEFSERFSREAQAVAALNHPNICTLYDVGPNYLVMEFVDGAALCGPLPIPEALAYAQQICEALEAAHARGIVHRDLKPANIKITPEGKVKVLDFGLASLGQAASSADPTNSPTLTISGAIMGTAGYMSPEQARGVAVDKRADIWAFGVILFEMLTGSPTFSGETVSDMLASVLKTDPDWSKLPAETPASVRKLLRRCLEREPKQRLRDIGDALFEINTSEEAAGKPTVSRPSRWWPVAVALPTIAALLLAVLHFREKPVHPPLMRFSIPAPEDTSGFNVASISPDGRQIAFSAQRKGHGDPVLYVRSLDTLSSRAVQGTEGAETPFWSPDGRFLAFFTRRDGKLKKVDLAGGAPQILCDSDSVGSAWNTEGVILFQRRADGGLYRVPAAGGTPVLVSKPDPARKETRHVYPQFLPDGRHYLFVAGSDQPGASTLNAASLDSPQRTVIMPVESNVLFAPREPAARVGHLLFVRGANFMAQPFDAERLRITGEAIPVGDKLSRTISATQGSVVRTYRFSVSASGETLMHWSGTQRQAQLAWFDRGGKKLETVGPVSEMNGVALAPDGVHIAAAIGDLADAQLWLLDAARGTSSRLTFDEPRNIRPVFSPDGSQVAFACGGTGLCRKQANGTGVEEKLLAATNSGLPGDWSPDGKLLIFTASGSDSAFDLFALPVSGERKPYSVLHTKANEQNARFSPDGKWIAYESDENGTTQVYVQPFPPGSGNGGKWQVSVDGGLGATWRRDGKELFYLSGTKLMAVEITTSAGSFHAGVPKILFDTHLSYAFSWTNYAPSADGRRFLIAAAVNDDKTQPLTVVLNWQAGLKK